MREPKWPLLALFAFILCQSPVALAAGPRSCPAGREPEEQTFEPARNGHALSSDERKSLTHELQAASDFSITVNTFMDPIGRPSPVSIVKTTLRAVPRAKGAVAENGIPPANDFAVQMRVDLESSAGHRVRRVELRFINAAASSVFLVEHDFQQKKEHQCEIPLMVVTGDPAHLEVGVVRVEVADGDVWTPSPLPSLTIPWPARQGTASAAEAAGSRAAAGSESNPSPQRAPVTKVYRMPKALNRPRPNYTEEARKNRVSGIVMARIVVDQQGSPNTIIPVSFLPDGLTEEAIAAIKQMRFQPAFKGDAPVAYRVSVEVEFNLRP